MSKRHLLRAWWWKLRFLRSYAVSLKRRAEVEQRLLDAANGKAPVPDAQECRRLALKLGDPSFK